MTLSELVKKFKFAATRHLLNLKSVIKGRGFEKFKKQYAFEEIIGSGGFGVVYSGIKLSNYQQVAIKFVERRQVLEWGKLEDERVPMEICMLSRCSKVSGVIDLIEYFSIPDGFLIVMERPTMCIDLYGLIVGHDHLNEQISRHLFNQIVDTTQQIMQVCKVIHRDIKNENIVIDMITGQTKLIDFGAATYLKTTKYHGFQGTRLYCPPEWCIHSCYLGQEATVWSLGCVLYSCLNGQLPFLNEKDICTKHLLGPLPKFQDYSTDADDLIQRCLAYEPFKRIKLDKLKRHKWFLAKVTVSWQQMLTELLQNKSSTIAQTLNNEFRKESGVNTSIQMLAESANKQRQNASTNQTDARKHETMAVPATTNPSTMKHQAITCIFDVQNNEKRRKERVKKQFSRSKTTRIIPAKLKQRAGSNDSGNDSCVQSASQSPLTSPIFPTTMNKFLL